VLARTSPGRTTPTTGADSTPCLAAGSATGVMQDAAGGPRNQPPTFFVHGVQTDCPMGHGGHQHHKPVASRRRHSVRTSHHQQASVERRKKRPQEESLGSIRRELLGGRTGIVLAKGIARLSGYLPKVANAAYSKRTLEVHPTPTGTACSGTADRRRLGP
jgi:hypothetical protein